MMCRMNQPPYTGYHQYTNKDDAVVVHSRCRGREGVGWTGGQRSIQCLIDHTVLTKAEEDIE